MSADSVAQHIRNMRNTEGYKILMLHWNVQREAIIAEGKKARRDEKTIKMWARLEGFDDAVALVNKLAKVDEELNDGIPVED